MQLPLPLAELSLPAEASMVPPLGRRVWVNRSLRMDRIEWVGFDMDYTLAVYRQAEMDRLSIEATARKLVERERYPEQLLSMQYRTDFPIRGLLIDKKLGNVLKMDRYRYVKKGFHGMRPLSDDERRQLYHSRRLRPGTARYHWVDTLYALAEVSIYAAAIDELEKQGTPDYEKLFTHVRECIDLAHRDGSILDEIMRNLATYVVRDPELGPTLHKLRSAGKKLFLLTNSHPAYTDRMMKYLFDGSLPEYPSWRNYFDVVVTASRKPGFFTEREPFLEVVDNGTTRPASTLERGRVYTGGNIVDFEQYLGASGDAILYVGDHIYGDVLRAKKETAWRTAMIIQELSDELEALGRCTEALERADQLDEARETLHHDLRARQNALKEVQKAIERLSLPPGTVAPNELEVPRVRYRKSIDKLRARIRAAEAELETLEGELSQAFHPFWGSLLKAGQEVSSFGDQVEAYACVYTSRVSNLLSYSPMHYFKSPRHRMAHEL
jgi:HAD superfamily 5'-nucleotidase-like hydrolase